MCPRCTATNRCSVKPLRGIVDFHSLYERIVVRLALCRRCPIRHDLMAYNPVIGQESRELECAQSPLLIT